MKHEEMTSELRRNLCVVQRWLDNALLCQGLSSSIATMTSHLVGLSEIAAMLGVSRQRAGQLVRDYEDFPSPVAELASGRIWETAAVKAWAKSHPVRPPGRPSGESVHREEA